MGKAIRLGCWRLVAFLILFVGMGDPAGADSSSVRAPLKKFLVIDHWPEGKSGGLGWWWPWQQADEWLKSPIPEGTALEVRSEDAISAYVTGFSGESRRVILKYHNNSASLDPAPRNDELMLVGHHFAWIPWNPASNSPACLVRRSAVSFINWPPENASYIYLLFSIIIGLKILDCIGKGSFAWLWSLLLYAALFKSILTAISVSAYSKSQCEPMAASFAQDLVRGGVIQPLEASWLESGPWIADSSIVSESQIAFFVAIVLAIRLLWPAYIGWHYLFVPHPVEQRLREGGASAQDIAAAMGLDVDVEYPPPEYKSRNWRRRIEKLQERLDAETKLLRSTIRHERTRAETEDRDP